MPKEPSSYKSSSRSRRRSPSRLEREKDDNRRVSPHSSSSSSSRVKEYEKSSKNVDKYEKDEKDLVGSETEEERMLKQMGFASFDSTKGKQVPGNNVSAVHVIHKRKYRQYMNRKGGFNRPLDFVA